MSDKNRWAIRDVLHGKTYFFRNWRDLVAFVNDQQPKKSVLFRKDKKDASSLSSPV